MSTKPTVIYYQSAGGVVVSPAGRVLLIERTVERVHEVRLPKGHIEPNEEPEDAALREVCEETGYCDLAIRADLGWHTVHFERASAFVVRRERYFLMSLVSTRQQAQQFASEREALFRPLWAAGFDQAERLLTFEAEKDVVRRASARYVGDDPAAHPPGQP